MLVIFLLLGFKRLIYNKFIPISLIQSLIDKGKFSKLVLGHIILIAYFKEKGYVLSSIYPKTPA